MAIESTYRRKIWRCGVKWINNEEVQTKDGCSQDIYQSNTEKFPSGKYAILNLRDGAGGLKDMKHECPNRVGSRFHHYTRINILEYDYHQQNYPCVVCGTKFNREKFPLCPTCMKLECRRCGNLQHWVVGKGLDCFECGARCDPRSVKYMEKEGFL